MIIPTWIKREALIYVYMMGKPLSGYACLHSVNKPLMASSGFAHPLYLSASITFVSNLIQASLIKSSDRDDECLRSATGAYVPWLPKSRG